jgi:invasion protein IalB
LKLFVFTNLIVSSYCFCVSLGACLSTGVVGLVFALWSGSFSPGGFPGRLRAPLSTMDGMMRKIFPPVALVLAGFLLAPSSAVMAEEAKNPTYGDWGYNCEKSPDGEEELCYVFQNVTKTEGGQLVLGARIAYREGEAQPMIVLTVPLGSLLPPGAALTMEGVDPVKMTYFLCAQDGCTTIATPLPAAMITAMKKGEQAVVRVAAPNQQVVGLPLSLKGFTKALASLKK